MSIPSVSIITPCYNSYKTLRVTLEELPKQTAWQHVVEYIIVDSSDDGITREFLINHPEPKLKTIFLEGALNPAIKRNVGAKSAIGNLLCFIDADAFPANDWIEKIIAANLSGVKAGGGSYKIPEFQVDIPIVASQYYLEFSMFMPYGKKRRLPMIPTCNLFCEKELFWKVGGIPEIRASEDSLFGININKVEPLIFFPDMVVYHIFREDVTSFLNNQYMLGKYIYVYRKYHYNKFYMKHPVFIIMLPIIVLLKDMMIRYRILRMGSKHLLPIIKSIYYYNYGLIKWVEGFISGHNNYKKLILELSPVK